jgi:tetratricopeptide (TPR) repeat protein
MDAGSWNDSDALTQRAVALIQQRRWQEALEGLDEVLSIDPFNAACHFHRGVALDELGRHDEALVAYQSAREIEPDHLDTLNRLALSLYQVGRSEDAISTFEQIEQMDPTYEPAYCNRVHIFVELGKFDQAEEVFYLGRLHREHCPRCYYSIGVAMQHQSRHAQAVRCLSRAIDLPGGGADVHRRLGDSLRVLGDLDAARLHYNHCLGIEPGNLAATVALVDLLIEQRRFADAETRLRKGLRTKPDHATLHLLSGRLAFLRNDLTAAQMALERAQMLDPTLPGPNVALAEIRIRLGAVAQAIAHLRQEMVLSRRDASILSRVARLQLDLKDIEGAHCSYKRLVTLAPERAAVWTNWGLLECRLGRFDAGRQAFDNALRIDPNLVAAKFNRVLALHDAGAFAQSQAALKSARAQHPGEACFAGLAWRLFVRSARVRVMKLLTRRG